MFNRQMRDVDWYVILFWHSAIALCTTTIIIAIFTNWSIFTYTGRQYALLTLCGFLDTLSLAFTVIAFQAGSLSFISLFGYMFVVYSFFADMFIFDETFSTREILGCLLILSVTVAVVLYKYWLEKKKSDSDFALQ